MAVMTDQAGVAGPRPAVPGRPPVAGSRRVAGRVFLALRHRRHFLTFDAVAAVGLPRGLRCGRSPRPSGAMYWMLRVLTAPDRHAHRAGCARSPSRRSRPAPPAAGRCACDRRRHRRSGSLRRRLARRAGGTGGGVAAGGRGARSRCRSRYNLVKFDARLHVPAPGPGLDPGQRAPPRGPRGQRRLAHRARSSSRLVHRLLAARRHPVRRLLPVDHAARLASARARRRLRRPDLPHRQRHRVHAAVHAAA